MDNINPAGGFFSETIPAVPTHFVLTGILCCVQQFPDFLSQCIVNDQFDRAFLGNGITDRCRRIERIRVILFQIEMFRQLFDSNQPVLRRIVKFTVDFIFCQLKSQSMQMFWFLFLFLS